MNYYHLWFNRADHVKDSELSPRIERFLAGLRERDLIAGWKFTRRKLGFGPSELGEFHVVIEVFDLTQLDRVFEPMAKPDPDIEALHQPVYSSVKDLRTALYRDYPDRFSKSK
ncbi:MAG: DUF6614 family protein [Phycisphaerae bacterium]